jgi:hypothetical protein
MAASSASVYIAGSRLGVPRMRTPGAARIVASQGFAPGNARQVDHPPTEEIGPPLTRVGLHQATAPRSRR